MKKKSTQRITRKSDSSQPLALNSPTIKEKISTYPFVHYPVYKGVFIAFSKFEESKKHFCDCSRFAIQNFFDLSSRYSIKINYNGGQHLSNFIFPKSFAEVIESKINPITQLSFKKLICHKCNLKTPRIKWDFRPGINKFKQYYGWYIFQKELELGKFGSYYLPKICPEELIEKIENEKSAKS